MARFKFVLSLSICASVLCLVLCNVYPNRVTIQEDEGFLIRLSLTEHRPLQSCQLARNHKIYFFMPGQNKTHNLPHGEVVHPFDPNNNFECGIRVYGANRESGGEWRLTSIDEDGNDQTGIAQVSVTPRYSECPTSPKAGQCKKTDMDTMEENDCSAQPSHYLCQFLSTGKMSESVLVENNSKEIGKSMKSPTITETGETVMECKFRGDQYEKITECYIEHVTSGRKFNIQEGLLDTRYSAYKTNFGEKVCQFEIHEELAEKDIGIWKMTMEVKNLHYYGPKDPTKFKTCKFVVEGSPEASLQNLIDRTSSVIAIKTIKDKERIECAKNVFYPITICYVSGDSLGQLTFSDDYEEMEDGNCAFDVGPGNWTCGFNGPSQSDKDYSQQFEVIKYETEVIDGAFKSRENGSSTLECHMIGGRPIKLCMFFSPRGKVYRLPTDNFNSTEYSYYNEEGGQMITGDCVIKFPDDVEIERGEWICVIGTTLSHKSTTWIEV